jgi:hypothetical protein
MKMSVEHGGMILTGETEVLKDWDRFCQGVTVRNVTSSFVVTHSMCVKCSHRRRTQNLLYNFSKANSFRLQVKLRTSRQSGRTKSHNSSLRDLRHGAY